MHDSRKSHLSPSRSGTSSRIRPSRHWPPSSKHGLRGLLLSRDELGGWIASFDQYKARAGTILPTGYRCIVRVPSLSIARPADALSTFRGSRSQSPAEFNRKCCRRALAGQHTENGFAARILFAFPPKRRRRWTDAAIDGTVDAAVEYVFDRLLNLRYANESSIAGEANDEAGPLDLDLDADAKAAWIPFVNTHADEQYDLAGPLSAAWSKLEGYAARFALIVQLIRWAAGDSADSYTGHIDAASIEAGATLSRWFCGEARRIYSLFAETNEDRDRRRLVEWIERRGGLVTRRSVHWLPMAAGVGRSG